jgi:hypothetical protein
VRLWNNAADQYCTVHVPTLPTAAQFDPNNSRRRLWHQWMMIGRTRRVHAVAFDAGDLSSGVYYYQMQAGMLMQSKKMLVVR